MKSAIFILISAILLYSCAKKATNIVSTPKPIENHTTDNKALDTLLTYNLQIKPLIDKYCIQCHNSQYILKLNNYAQVKINADNGEINKHVLVIKNMPPKNQPQLSADELKMLAAWLTNGAKE
ncbi:MAG: hypothetical protein HQ463_01090 [Bacteroidetes bacterium]|nr:hypothetical protein [Bacteroidota bacterium]